MDRLPGISGSLFPPGYLADGLDHDLSTAASWPGLDRRRRQLLRWWSMVERECGPATGLPTLVERVARPLAALLGFRVDDVSVVPGRVSARLTTPRGTAVALLLHGWAGRQPSIWRDVCAAARDYGARWCLFIAPPFVSIVDAGGRATRRSIDFTLPDALEPGSFTRLWWLAHASSFDIGTIGVGTRNEQRTSAIEWLVARGREHQEAVGRDLRRGVTAALEALVPVIDGTPPPFGQALTIVYRVLFLLFAESRALVPDRHPVYAGAYSVGSLCRDAVRGIGQADTWEGLGAITRLLRRGCATAWLTVAPFNGRLFAQGAAPALEARTPGARRREPGGRDEAMRRALVALSTRPGPSGAEHIRYADLGVEELGSVYERVLDIEPPPGRGRSPQPAGRPAAGRESRRKATGTYYTPRSLTEFVVRRTLEPLVSDRSAADILQLRVLDPAMGSGAFLVAACRFLSAAYERALIAEGLLHEADVDAAVRADIRRRVAERCLAGVDVNPVAAELARLSIWLTTLARGRPLGFLDHRLRSGNSLLGATPADLHRIGGRGRSAGGVSLPLFEDDALSETMARAARPLADLLSRRDHSADDVRDKERTWKNLAASDGPLGRWRQACSLWCSQWLWPAGAGPRPSAAELRAAIDGILRGDRTLPTATLAGWLTTVRRIEEDHGLFHWPLEFPDVFHAPDGTPLENPGFDAVVGNPPWEMLRRDPGHPAHERGLAFLKQSGVFRLGQHGHVNLYQPFVERALSLSRRGGRVGLVLPWGMASDDGAGTLRREIAGRHGLDTIVGLDNTDGLFPVHRGLRFLAMVTRVDSPGAGVVRGRFAVRSAADLDDLPARDVDPDGPAFPVRLTSSSLAVIGGSTSRWPDGRHPRLLELAGRLFGRWPALGRADGWHVHFGRELNATDDRGLFGPTGWPVLEGKHIRPFGVDVAAARHHVRPADARRVLGPEYAGRSRLAYRDVSGAANRLSLIAAVLPADTVSTHTLACLREPLPIEQQHFLCGLFNSWVLNAIARMLMGQHVTTSLVEDLPVPPWTGGAAERAISAAAAGLAVQGSGDDARLQAAVATLYGLDTRTFETVADSLPLVSHVQRSAAVAIFGSGRHAL